MLESLSIKNFRLFDTFRLERLSSVNLFVGKNNSGKSALLEAIQIWASNASPSVLHQLISVRDGFWESDRQDGIEFDIAQSLNANLRAIDFSDQNPLRSLFRSHHLPRLGEPGIEIGQVKGAPLAIQMTAYQVIMEAGALRQIRISPDVLDESTLVDVHYAIEAQEGDAFWYLVPLFAGAGYIKKELFSRPPRKPKCALQSVPAQHLSDQKLALLWDAIRLTDAEQTVTDSLRIVQANLAGVAFVAEPTEAGGHRIPIVRLKDSPERFPLKTLGDGMTRLLEITLALVSAKDGILVIDEFENGVHWSTQPQVWRLVFQAAEELNVQVFATTHSQDCIRAFHSIWKRNEHAGTFYRMDRNGSSGPKPTRYDCQTLADAIETEVEVR